MSISVPGRFRPLFPAMSLLVALAFVTPASAKPWSAVCTNLAGVRVEDDGTNSAFPEDAIKGASWTYRWDVATRKATLTLPASHASDGKPHQQDGLVSAHRGGFFVIVSTLPGAVWTHAIYPETGRVLATQSTTKDGTSLSGRVLVGTCAMSSDGGRAAGVRPRPPRPRTLS